MVPKESGFNKSEETDSTNQFMPNWKIAALLN